jgi:hypothetical protein
MIGDLIFNITISGDVSTSPAATLRVGMTH